MLCQALDVPTHVISLAHWPKHVKLVFVYVIASVDGRWQMADGRRCHGILCVVIQHTVNACSHTIMYLSKLKYKRNKVLYVSWCGSVLTGTRPSHSRHSLFAVAWPRKYDGNRVS